MKMPFLRCKNCGSSKSYDKLPDTKGLCEDCFRATQIAEPISQPQTDIADLNRDGVVDTKDTSFAATVLAKSKSKDKKRK